MSKECNACDGEGVQESGSYSGKSLCSECGGSGKEFGILYLRSSGWYIVCKEGYMHPDGVIRTSMLNDKNELTGYFDNQKEAEKTLKDYS